MDHILLRTSLDKLDEAADRLDKCRASSTNITIPRDLYAGLVLDHSKLVGRLAQMGLRAKGEDE